MCLWQDEVLTKWLCLRQDELAVLRDEHDTLAEEAAQKAQLERWLAELADEKEDAISELQGQMSALKANQLGPQIGPQTNPDEWP